MTYETDQGTLQILKHLTPVAAARLQDALTAASIGIGGINFHAADFAGRQDIKQLKLEKHESKTNVLIATATMNDGVVWRRGSLRVPGVVLPEVVRIAAKGRPLEEIVEGAPFSGFIITGLVQDGSGSSAKLRIRCTAEKTGPIIIDIAAAPKRQASEMGEALLAYADVNIDAVAERALRKMPVEDAFAALLNLVKGKASHQEVLSVRYGELIEANVPKHLHVHDILKTGIIRLQRFKSGIRANAVINNPGYPYSFIFEKGAANFDPDKDPKGGMNEIRKIVQPSLIGRMLFGKMHEEPVQPEPFAPTVRNILGFDAPSASVGQFKANGDWGKPRYAIENDCTVGSFVKSLR